MDFKSFKSREFFGHQCFPTFKCLAASTDKIYQSFPKFQIKFNVSFARAEFTVLHNFIRDQLHDCPGHDVPTGSVTCDISAQCQLSVMQLLQQLRLQETKESHSVAENYYTNKRKHGDKSPPFAYAKPLSCIYKC